MIVNLDSYISYMDCTEHFLPFLKGNGADNLIEASGGTEADAPMDERIGSVVRSIRELHLPRYSKSEHHQISVKFVEDGDIGEIPESASWIGIFYFGELGETCEGDKDLFDGDEYSPTWGSVMFLTADHSYSAGKLSSGTLPKLVAFWGTD